MASIFMSEFILIALHFFMFRKHMFYWLLGWFAFFHFYFYPILAAFNKLKIMTEVAHDN